MQVRVPERVSRSNLYRATAARLKGNQRPSLSLPKAQQLAPAKTLLSRRGNATIVGLEIIACLTAGSLPIAASFMAFGFISSPALLLGGILFAVSFSGCGILTLAHAKTSVRKIEKNKDGVDPSWSEGLKQAITRTYQDTNPSGDNTPYINAINDYIFLITPANIPRNLSRDQTALITNRIASLGEEIQTLSLRRGLLYATDHFIAVILPPQIASVDQTSIRGKKHSNGAFIGAGNMAEVYEGLVLKADGACTTPGAKCAIKISTNTTHKAANYFRDEIAIQLGIAHNNGVVVAYAKLSDSALAMEYIPHGTLKSAAARLRNGTNSAIATIGQRILTILSDITFTGEDRVAKRIFHRDIKLANIFIDLVNGTLKIGDFGLARMEDEGSSTGIAPGTAPYQAPCLQEYAVMSSEDKGSPRASWILTKNEIYAVGVCLHYLLTGTPPLRIGTGSRPFCVWDDKSHGSAISVINLATIQQDYALFKTMPSGSPEALAKIASYRLVRHSNISEPMHAVLERLLAFDPAQSPDTLEQAAELVRGAIPEMRRIEAEIPALELEPPTTSGSESPWGFNAIVPSNPGTGSGSITAEERVLRNFRAAMASTNLNEIENICHGLTGLTSPAIPIPTDDTIRRDLGALLGAASTDRRMRPIIGSILYAIQTMSEEG